MAIVERFAVGEAVEYKDRDGQWHQGEVTAVIGAGLAAIFRVSTPKGFVQVRKADLRASARKAAPKQPTDQPPLLVTDEGDWSLGIPVVVGCPADVTQTVEKAAKMAADGIITWDDAVRRSVRAMEHAMLAYGVCFVRSNDNG